VATAAEDIKKAVNDCLDKLDRAGLHTAGARVILKTESERSAAYGLPGIAASLWHQAEQFEIVGSQMDSERFNLNGLISDLHSLSGTEKPAEAAESYGSIHQKAKDITDGLTGVQKTLDRLIDQVRMALDGGNPDDVVGATTEAWKAAYDAAAYTNWASELAEKEAQRCREIGAKKSR
jgi:hypothetical protein